MKMRLLIAVSLAWMVEVAEARLMVVGIADACSSDSRSGAKYEYSEAVYAAGAVPFVLPATTNVQAIAALMARIDMLLLAGGEDVAAERYGMTDVEKFCVVNARRDAWEFALLDEAIRRRLPIFGICRGCQILNVRFGGTLWRDLLSEKPRVRNHKLTGEHAVTLAKGSCLARMVGGESASVNSRHHQAVRDMAKGFKATAVSEDGVIEAIEGVDYPAVGVQFHPESLFVRNGRREFLPLFRGEFLLQKAMQVGSDHQEREPTKSCGIVELINQ